MTFIQKIKFKLMVKWCKQFNLTPVEFLEILGTAYIRHRDGSLWRLANVKIKKPTKH